MKLTGVKQVAEQTFAYFFERPSNFEFAPGQFLEIRLEELSPSDPVRSFSIASAPSEPQIMIATRNRDSSFKRALRTISPGSDVCVDGPYGSFLLKKDHALHVLIAGGIGITPFRSMIMKAIADRTHEQLLLFHANRDMAGAPFAPEMTHLSESQDNFRYIPTLTQSSENWDGEKGHIDSAILMRYVDLSRAAFYISGPTSMVRAEKEMLMAAQVGAEQILSEAFEGY